MAQNYPGFHIIYISVENFAKMFIMQIILSNYRSCMRLLKFGVNLMNHLNYPQKFTLIGLILSIPIGMLTILLIFELNSRINFTEKELYGNQYLRILRELRERIPQNKVNWDYLVNYDINTDDTLGGTDKIIDKNLADLFEIDKNYGLMLGATDQLQNIDKIWLNLKLRRRQFSQETINFLYEDFGKKVNKLSSDIGHTSNLIIDPDLDTYYLMDASLIKLPEIQNLLVEIQVLSGLINWQKSSTSEQRAMLIVMAGRLKNITAELNRNLEVGFNNNPQGNIRPQLSRKLAEFSAHIKDLNKRMNFLIYPSSTLETSAYIAQANQGLELSFHFWDMVVDELDFLLQKRIDGFEQKQRIILALVFLVLVIVTYLFIAFYQVVMQTVNALEESAKKMSQGVLDQPIFLDNKDELGQVVRSFNKIADALIHANQEILVLNDRLKIENLRMSAELDITRKIQQMLLPKESELQSFLTLDIAGFMEPASEVGGDYYDVLSHNGAVKIGIGDVTGHGLESGVLMIMVQTAVRTLIANNETDPVKFISAINQTIYENVQRMESDKNLSFALIDYREGILNVSGQHEQMIIVRDSGKIEQCDTIDLGFPIGLDENITRFIASASVKLDQGDVVVLYTDGITEAENVNRKHYGIDRLCNVVKLHRRKSASEIRQQVIKDVREHIGLQKIFDDITLIVFKQKLFLPL